MEKRGTGARHPGELSMAPKIYRVFKYDGDRGEVLVDTIYGEDYEMAKITAQMRHGVDAYIK